MTARRVFGRRGKINFLSRLNCFERKLPKNYECKSVAVMPWCIWTFFYVCSCQIKRRRRWTKAKLYREKYSWRNFIATWRNNKKSLFADQNRRTVMFSFPFCHLSNTREKKLLKSLCSLITKFDYRQFSLPPPSDIISLWKTNFSNVHYF